MLLFACLCARLFLQLFVICVRVSLCLLADVLMLTCIVVHVCEHAGTVLVIRFLRASSL